MSSVAISPSVEQLARDLDAREPADGAVELARWLATSSRFRTFAETHRDKIRKKLRTATDPEARRDVRVELLVARMLLADARMDLAFEPYGAGKLGPDFTVTFRGTTRLDLEVTRLRHLPDISSGVPLIGKLRQLRPGVPNALLVAIDGDTSEALDVAGLVRALRSRADAKDEAFFARRGFDGSRDFYERFLRLGTVFVACEGGVGAARASRWPNRSARIPVPEPAARAVLAGLRAEP